MQNKSTIFSVGSHYALTIRRISTIFIRTFLSIVLSSSSLRSTVIISASFSTRWRIPILSVVSAIRIRSVIISHIPLLELSPRKNAPSIIVIIFNCLLSEASIVFRVILARNISMRVDITKRGMQILS